MKKGLPPLQGLYYFYTAAEKGSFKLAAESLFVTPAAVSQQIRQLEEWLECDLFIRQHRNVKLTNEGDILFQSASKGFSEIQNGVRRLNQDPDPTRLSLSTHPSFSQHWLLPRINEFRQLHPKIALLMDPRNELVDFQDGSIDLCIRYGKGDYPDIESQWLMDEVLYPACHPRYQQEHKLDSIQDLSHADLIEDVWPDMDWRRWLENMDVINTKPPLKYNGSNYVLEGALAAQGVALVKHSLAYRYLQEGKLVRIGNIAIQSTYSYYLCAPHNYFNRDKVRVFSDWIKTQVKASEKQGLESTDIQIMPANMETMTSGKL